MILFYKTQSDDIFATETKATLTTSEKQKLAWIFGTGNWHTQDTIQGNFIGPRKEMITPWSTNAVEITQNMGLSSITRIEKFSPNTTPFDPMLQSKVKQLDQAIFTIKQKKEPIRDINNMSDYNREEGLALSKEEINYLESIATKLDRKLTDSEVFGFSQVNSEHCRHKIFNGTFIIDGKEKTESLFSLIKKTTKQNHNSVVSAYKDNAALIKGPIIEQFAPITQDKADFFEIKKIESVISIKAETHNFPTTVEPFNGAATGAGGEIRDRMAVGKASIPLAGTAVYMTPYPRLNKSKPWEQNVPKRDWLYQTPAEILIKASNGASD